MTTLKRPATSDNAQHSAAFSAVSDPKFWAKTARDPRGFCRVWVGYRDRQGYGLVGRPAIQRSPMLAHRYAFLLTHGSIPRGAVIRHSCDNPPCVEPTHLLIGTQADNIADRQARGRHRPGRLQGTDHPAHVLTDAQVLELRAAASAGAPRAELAVRYGVGVTSIGRIIRGLNWTHLPGAAPTPPRIIRSVEADEATVFAAVRDYIAAQGYSPSVRDVAATTGLSLNLVHRRLRTLIQVGKLIADPGVARSLRLAA